MAEDQRQPKISLGQAWMVGSFIVACGTWRISDFGVALVVFGVGILALCIGSGMAKVDRELYR